MKKSGFTLAEVLAGRGNMLPVFSKAGFTLAEVLITLGIIRLVLIFINCLPTFYKGYKCIILI